LSGFTIAIAWLKTYCKQPGSWFDIIYSTGALKVIRYSSSGEIECNGFYRNLESKNKFLSKKTRITYPSNCKTFTLTIGEAKLMFERIQI